MAREGDGRLERERGLGCRISLDFDGGVGLLGMGFGVDGVIGAVYRVLLSPDCAFVRAVRRIEAKVYISYIY